ncbi:MAG: hypothetical protein JNM78_08585 [Cyclobacteriaceae bacterium]|nr:hypothetical protein [Cyclobacteriaceae bacterium]
MDIGLYAGYAFLIVAVAAAIVLPLINALKSPSGLLKSLAAAGTLVVVFVIAYVLSGDEVSTRAAASGVNAGASKFIGAGLIMFYIILVVAAIGVVFSEINKAIK